MEVGRSEAEEQEELRRQIHNFENDPSVFFSFFFFVTFPSIFVQIFTSQNWNYNTFNKISAKSRPLLCKKFENSNFYFYNGIAA